MKKVFIILSILVILLGLTSARAVAADNWWKPTVGQTFQWQLTTPVNTSVKAEIYDIDYQENSKAIVDKLHSQGIRVICYLETGSWESYRPDAKLFPAIVKGKTLNGYASEKYLDIRRLDILGPLMQSRLDECKSKGFDGVEPDIDDSYLEGKSVTGFPLTIQDQLTYNKFIADQAHLRGLSIGLKNGADEQFVLAMQQFTDWALNEQCNQFNECSPYSAFISSNKPVFQVEYKLSPSQFCDKDRKANFTGLKKTVNLTATVTFC